MSNRLDSLSATLLNDTVLEEWFRPMQNAIDKVRYSRKRFSTLSADFFILLGCLRQLQGEGILRNQIQTLFDIDEYSTRIPLARSTWSDALANPFRTQITRNAVQILVDEARSKLPDRFAAYAELGDRALYAIDATYQDESSHYQASYPHEGGTDNRKGHMTLTTYDMRAGIAVDSNTETTSIDEMRFVKEVWRASWWTSQKNAIYVVDRAYIEPRYWDQRKTQVNATVITRMKTIFKYRILKELEVLASPVNEGVTSDTLIQLKSSKEEWRLIEFTSPDGNEYSYLSNDMKLTPGMIAFLYHRRWDEEKYFDNYKTDLANSKAWGKSPVAIEQQALFGLATHLLMRLFLHKKGQELGLTEDHQTQQTRHQKKESEYSSNWNGNFNRVFFKILSKITKQAWRFVKNSFLKKPSLQLYELKLRPVLMAYL